MADTLISLRAYLPPDRSAIVDLSLRAWEPVFTGMRASTLPFVYDSFYPDGWQARQTADISAFLEQEGERVWVAEVGGQLAGFVGVQLHPEDNMGEIAIIAVDPRVQRQGVAAQLMAYAEKYIRASGMNIVMVETGGDPGHEPARSTYEREGYQRWQVARYFKKL